MHQFLPNPFKLGQGSLAWPARRRPESRHPWRRKAPERRNAPKRRLRRSNSVCWGVSVCFACFFSLKRPAASLATRSAARLARRYAPALAATRTARLSSYLVGGLCGHPPLAARSGVYGVAPRVPRSGPTGLRRYAPGVSVRAARRRAPSGLYFVGGPPRLAGASPRVLGRSSVAALRYAARLRLPPPPSGPRARGLAFPPLRIAPAPSRLLCSRRAQLDPERTPVASDARRSRRRDRAEHPVGSSIGSPVPTTTTLCPRIASALRRSGLLDARRRAQPSPLRSPDLAYGQCALLAPKDRPTRRTIVGPLRTPK